MVTRLGIAIIWLIHWLPLPVQAVIGWVLGMLMYVVIVPRRRVVHTNLRLCFPELDDKKRVQLARSNAVAVVRSILERGVVWWSSKERICKLVELQGFERVRALHAEGRAIIVLMPHFVGLDMAGARICMEMDCASMQSAQKDKVLEHSLVKGRLRFGAQKLFTRQDGVRTIVKALKEGRPFYYLPDLDYGAKDSIFVPFFGIQTATITGLSRLAQLSKAVVLPVIVRMKPFGCGYVAEFGSEWENFPTQDIVADTTRMNAYIEAEVRKTPEQYYWVHKRFKTRPPGEENPYKMRGKA